MKTNKNICILDNMQPHCFDEKRTSRFVEKINGRVKQIFEGEFKRIHGRLPGEYLNCKLRITNAFELVNEILSGGGVTKFEYKVCKDLLDNKVINRVLYFSIHGEHGEFDKI